MGAQGQPGHWSSFCPGPPRPLQTAPYTSLLVHSPDEAPAAARPPCSPAQEAGGEGQAGPRAQGQPAFQARLAQLSRFHKKCCGREGPASVLLLMLLLGGFCRSFSSLQERFAQSCLGSLRVPVQMPPQAAAPCPATCGRGTS